MKRGRNFLENKIEECKFRAILFGSRHEKTCHQGFVNNTGTDQTAHSHSLISAFVIRLLESIICKLATGEISIF